MTEISLPCCDTPTLVADLGSPIHCDHCGIDLDLVDDGDAITALAA